MTLQQQAHGLIDSLSDDCVKVVIQVMQRMQPKKQQIKQTDQKTSDVLTPKMKAYLRMQELRKETSKYDVSEEQWETALDEKYGTFG